MTKIFIGEPGHIEEIHDTLCEYIRSYDAFKNVMLAPGSGKKLPAFCDIIYIGRGGVILFLLLSNDGVYDSPPPPNNWLLNLSNANSKGISNILKDAITNVDQNPQQGDEFTNTYENPFVSLQKHAKIISELLAHEEISSHDAIKCCILCVTKGAKFTTPHADLIYQDQLVDYVKKTNYKKVFTRRNMSAAADIIYAFDIYNKEMEAVKERERAEAERRVRALRSLQDIGI